MFLNVIRFLRTGQDKCLTAVAFAVEQFPPDKVLYPVGLADAGPGGLVAAPVPGALVLADQGVQAQDLQAQQIRVRFQL